MIFINYASMTIYIMMIFFLFIMSFNDLYDRTVSHILTIGLAILGLCNAIYMFDKWNWMIFGIMAGIYILLFYVLDKLHHPIGGADIKLMIISFLFLTDMSEFMPYLISWAGVSIIVFIYLILRKRYSEGIAYIPVLSLALITAKTLTSIYSIGWSIGILCFLYLAMFLMVFVMKKKGVLMSNVQEITQKQNR